MELLTFCGGGRDDIRSADLRCFFDCGHLVKTRLPSFLPISWHLFVNEENFSQHFQLLLIPIHTPPPPGAWKGVQIDFNPGSSHPGV